MPQQDYLHVKLLAAGRSSLEGERVLRIRKWLYLLCQYLYFFIFLHASVFVFQFLNQSLFCSISRTDIKLIARGRSSLEGERIFVDTEMSLFVGFYYLYLYFQFVSVFVFEICNVEFLNQILHPPNSLHIKLLA